MSLVVSTSFASMSICRVAVSSLSMSASTPGTSLSVVRTMSCRVRRSGIMVLRGESVVATSTMILVGSLYRKGITTTTSGSSAAGSLAVTRPIRVRESQFNCHPQLSSSARNACNAVTFRHFSVTVGGAIGRPSGPTALTSLGSNWMFSPACSASVRTASGNGTASNATRSTISSPATVLVSASGPVRGGTTGAMGGWGPDWLSTARHGTSTATRSANTFSVFI